MESEAPAAGQPPEADTKKEGWGATLRFFLILFLLAIGLRSFIAAPFNIPSGSMLPNLMIGDYLFISKWSYGYSRHSLPFGIGWWDGRVLERLPARGDIAVFRYPGPENEDFVKRVIGLPGDRIAMQGGRLILNGEEVRRQRIADWLMPISPNSPCRAVCAYARYRETLPGGRSWDVLDQTGSGPGDDFPEIVVPDGHLFVMGDNRDDSYDSRFEVAAGGVGLLPTDRLLGRAMIGFFSTDGSAEWALPWTWFSAARWERVGQTWP